MIIKTISKTQTEIYKGVGILFIIFHNYFHWTSPSPGENEFGFSPTRINIFFHQIVKEPFEIINILFSYFGHYFVQAFIFISAVGLTMSILNKKSSYMNFIFQRLRKLYPLLIVTLVFVFFFRIFFENRLMNVTEWKEMFWKFLFIHVFLKNQAFSITGPLWFFGLIFQLYLLFPLLYKWIKQFDIKVFLLISLFSYSAIFIEHYYIPLPEGVFFMVNSIAHLPEFCFGIYIALNSNKKIHSAVFIISVFVFILGNFFWAFYPFTFLSVMIIIYWIISNWFVFSEQESAKHKITSKINNFLVHVGKLSMLIFVIHGLMRSHFVDIFNQNWAIKLLGAFFFFIAVYGLSIPASILYKNIYNLLFLCKKQK